MSLTFNTSVTPSWQWDYRQSDSRPLTLDFGGSIYKEPNTNWLTDSTSIITLPGYVYTEGEEKPQAQQKSSVTRPASKPRARRKKKVSTPVVNQPMINGEVYLPFQGVRNPNAKYQIIRAADGKLYETEMVDSGFVEIEPPKRRFSEQPPAQTFWGRVGQGFMKFWDGLSDFASSPVSTVKNWICGKPEPNQPATLVDNVALCADVGVLAATSICAAPVGIGIGIFEGLNKFVNWLIS